MLYLQIVTIEGIIIINKAMTLLEFHNINMFSSIILLVVVLAIIYVYQKLCDKVGTYAQDRGYSYWAFYLISIFCNPLVGYIIAVIVCDRRR